jgi:hypothetical protein
MLIGPSCLALVIGGCPKRQTVTRVIYTPAPPGVGSPTSETSAGTLLIQEPAAPEPVAEPIPEATPEPPPKPPPRRRTTETTAPAAEPETPEPVAVPALEPHETPAQQSDLKRQVITLEQNVQQRIAVIEQKHSPSIDGKALGEARAFLNRSREELKKGNLHLALNFAQKASLLADAAEQKP